MLNTAKKTFQIALIIMGIASPHLFGTPATWVGGTYSGGVDLTNPVNWSPASVPTNDVATFNGSAKVLQPEIYTGGVSTSLTLGHIVFPAPSPGTYSYSFGIFGNLKLSGAGITNSSTSQQTFYIGYPGQNPGTLEFANNASNDSTNSGSVIYVMTSGPLGISTLTFDGNSNGAGEFFLDPGTYSGIYGSKMQLIGSLSSVTMGALSTGSYATVLLGNTNTLTLGSTNQTMTIEGIISGPGSKLDLTASSGTPGSLTLTNANTYDGGTSVTAATTLFLKKTGSLAPTGALSLTASGATFDISGVTPATSITIGDLTGVTGSVVNLGSVGLTEGTSNSTIFGGVIQGTAGITKIGSGLLTLTGANTYTGGTTINSGEVALSGAGTLAATGAVTLKGSAVFAITAVTPATSVTIGDLASISSSTMVNLGTVGLVLGTTNSTTYAGSITGSSTLTKVGTGTLSLTGTATTFSGKVNIDQGTLGISTFGSLGNSSGFNFAPGTYGASFSTLQINGSTTIPSTTPFTIASGFTGNISTAALTNINSVISGAGILEKSGASTLTLSATNTYSGNTLITGGELKINGVQSTTYTGVVNMSNGTTLDISGISSGPYTVGGLSGGGNTANINLGFVNLIDNQSLNTTFAGNINGSSALTKEGTGKLTLSGNNTNFGGVVINQGTIAISSFVNIPATGGNAIFFQPGSTSSTTSTLQINGNVTLTNSQDIVIANGFTANFDVPSPYIAQITGFIGGTGGILQKSDTGTLILTGANGYTGGTNIVQGTLQVPYYTNLGTGNITFGPQTTTSTTSTLKLTSNTSVSNAAIKIAPGFIANFYVDSTATLGELQGPITDISSGGILQKSGPSQLFLLGANTYSGGTNITAGTLFINTGSNIGTGAINFENGGGTYTSSTLALETSSTITNPVTLATGFTGNIDIPLFDTGTFTGTFSGGGSLGKVDAGKLVLTHANTYTGGTNLTGGSLFLNGSGTLGTGPVNLAGGTTLDITGITPSSFTLGNINGAGGSTINIAGKNLITNTTTSSTYAGNITGSGGSLTKLGTGTFYLTGTNSYTGGTNIEQGAITIPTSNNIGTGGINFIPGSTSSTFSQLNLTGSMTLPDAVTIASGFTANINTASSTTSTIQGAITGVGGTLQKIGAGTLILTGTNDGVTGYTTTDISQGALEVASQTNLGTGGINFVPATGTYAATTSLLLLRTDSPLILM